MSSAGYFDLQNVSKAFAVRTGFFARGESFYALNDVSLSFGAGKFYGLIGESGSGKTTLGRIMAGLTRPTSGRVLFGGRDRTRAGVRERREFGHKVQFVFQNPYLSLDGRWRVQSILEEGIASMPRAEREARVCEALRWVGLKEDYAGRFPRQLSGGERQRVAIARALAVRPEFMILDEPTSQLDVSVQAEIVEVLKGLRKILAGGLLFITHDIALVSHLVDTMMILYEGRVVEEGPAEQILSSAGHEYTRRLLEAIPAWPF